MNTRLTEALTGARPYIIAEIGNNHNGSFDRALEMAGLAAQTGADCVKFQMRNNESLYREASLAKAGNDLGTEYILDLLDKFELTRAQHEQLKLFCEDSLGVDYLCTPWDVESARFLNSIGVEGFKIASADLTNIPLIEEIIGYGKWIFASTGMSSSHEIKETARLLDNASADYVLLHCNSTYPAPFADINLRYMQSLQNFTTNIGYSGHERGYAPSLAAVALGAKVIERHFTLDRSMEGPDHSASLEFTDFKEMVQLIAQTHQALGSNFTERHLSQGELMNRENLAKSVVARHGLPAGTILSKADLDVRSPGQGLSPQRLEELVGLKLQRKMEKHDYFFESDITGVPIVAGQWYFKRPWGVPVRFHDYSEITPDGKSGIALVEFHLSYQDMHLDPKSFLTATSELDFIVHAPELFQNSELLDLTASDEAYRLRSIENMQRVIDLTLELKKLFPKTLRPGIVTNVGGFTMDEPLSSDQIEGRYEKLKDSLSRLDDSGVEVLIQTMAPFPWHFGGQRYQNLFVRADQIVRFCSDTKTRICFDVSHSWLACQHLGLDFYQFANSVGPYTSHLHLSDARGVNGEGFQIGDGDIDFDQLGNILNERCPGASFIPEIWQGHKNKGEGFWLALDRLNVNVW